MNRTKKLIRGVCSVCEKQGNINFEHVPPQSCGNKQTRYTYSTLKDIFVPTGEKKRIMQGGLGYYAFCENCNNQFGSWYVKDYSVLYKTACQVLKIKTSDNSLVYPFEIYPLRIIKQIICMFLAVNHNSNFQFDKNILNDFVLDKHKTELSSQFKIFAFYNRGGKPRILPFTVIGNIENFTSQYYSEIAFPPFGFVLAYNSEKPDERLIDITYFTNYSYDTKCSLMLQFPILPTHTHYPCTYKTKGEIERKE